jgi:hypothetical protein
MNNADHISKTKSVRNWDTHTLAEQSQVSLNANIETRQNMVSFAENDSTLFHRAEPAFTQLNQRHATQIRYLGENAQFDNFYGDKRMRLYSGTEAKAPAIEVENSKITESSFLAFVRSLRGGNADFI